MSDVVHDVRLDLDAVYLSEDDDLDGLSRLAGRVSEATTQTRSTSDIALPIVMTTRHQSCPSALFHDLVLREGDDDLAALVLVLGLADVVAKVPVVATEETVRILGIEQVALGIAEEVQRREVVALVRRLHVTLGLDTVEQPHEDENGREREAEEAERT